MSSDMRSDSWAASVKQILTRPSEARLAEVAGTLPPRALPRVPRVEREPPLPSAARKESGLRARLQFVDAVAVVGAWVIVGTLLLPATTTVRQWGAQVAAAAVTLIAMQILGLYRSRLCVQRGQETARIVIAVGAGRRRPRVAARRWKPKLRRHHRRCRVVHSRLDGVPLDVPPVASCAAGPGSVPPGTRHDRGQ